MLFRSVSVPTYLSILAFTDSLFACGFGLRCQKCVRCLCCESKPCQYAHNAALCWNSFCIATTVNKGRYGFEMLIILHCNVIYLICVSYCCLQYYCSLPKMFNYAAYVFAHNHYDVHILSCVCRFWLCPVHVSLG